MITQPYLKILRHPSLSWFLFSRFLSSLATGIAYILMTWFLLEKANQVSAVALLMICFWIPTAVVGPLAGVLVDRLSKKRLLVTTYLLRAGTFFSFFFLLYNDLTPGSVYFLAFFQGLLTSVQDPLQSALVRHLIDDSDLVYANTALDILYELGNVGGMGLAGLVMWLLSIQYSILLLGFLVLGAALAACFIKIDAKVHVLDIIEERLSKHSLNKRHANFSNSFWAQDIKNCIHYVKSQKMLCVLYFTQLLILIEFMTAPILLAPYAKNILHANSAQYGQMEAALSLGLVLGSLCMPWLVKKNSEKNVAVVGAVGCILIFAALEIGGNILFTQLIYFLFGLCLMVWPLLLTNAQQLTDRSYQGRIHALFNALAGMIILFVYLLIYVFGNKVAIQHLYKFEIGVALTASFFVWHYRNQIKIF